MHTHTHPHTTYINIYICTHLLTDTHVHTHTQVNNKRETALYALGRIYTAWKYTQKYTNAY
jgi:hypothetical protein